MHVIKQGEHLKNTGHSMATRGKGGSDIFLVHVLEEIAKMSYKY